MELSTILLPVLCLGSMGLVFGVGLGFAGVKFKVEEDERLPLLREALPGANCGGCGFPGCDGFATAVIEGKAQPNGCPVGGTASALRIGEILGVMVDAAERKVAFVKCGGNCDKSASQYTYDGMNDCTAAMHLAAGGSKSCTYGCLGSGSCVTACKFDAITIVDGIAAVDHEKCSACGMCTAACPKKLIELIPFKSDVQVACNSLDNGKIVRSHCSVGCIGCKLCVKACGDDAIHVDRMLASIDYQKCTGCNECAKKCPTSVIIAKGFIKEAKEKVV